jgi:multiple sugar transport system permease protein
MSVHALTPRTRKRIGRFFLYVALAILMVYAFFPTFWLISTSLKPQLEAFQNPPTWIPHTITFHSYRILPEDHAGFVQYLKNSFIVGIATTVITLIAAAHAGYALSRFRFRGARALVLLILATQMFPYVTILISLYTLFRQLHLLNTYQALILAFTAFSLPFSIWMMKGFCDTVPADLEEAARVDGASRLRALYDVLLPVIAPGVVAIGLFTFLTAWNELLFALAMTISPTTRTIPPCIALTSIGEFQDRWPDMMAASVVVSIPVIILFTIFQRQLVRGLTAGAVKG